MNTLSDPASVIRGHAAGDGTSRSQHGPLRFPSSELGFVLQANLGAAAAVFHTCSRRAVLARPG